jgi:RNA polymerase sigma factor for flagellar operon FliA
LLRTAAGDLEAALGRAPSDPEIGAYCGISSRQILELEALSAAANTISSQDGDWFAAAADPDADSPVAVAEASDRARALQAAMGRLPDRYSFVLRRYYFDGATLDLIAGQLGVTKVRVQQLRTQAELRLRADPDLLVELDHQ